MDAERDALAALFWATRGYSWNNNQGWCTDAPLSEWYGVEVSDGRVVKLDLRLNNLQGSIPKELGQLDALTILNLYNNQLGGSIPKELGQLGALTILYLCNNKLEGSIPKELGQLGALTILYLCNNKLEGEGENVLREISPDHDRLHFIEFVGSIPKELGKLGALTILYLDNNKLEGSIPKELGKLGALTKLHLYKNKLGGSIPKELGKLGALTKLHLHKNKLEGMIPKELGQLGALTELSLQMNQLEGSLPKELGQLGALKELSLYTNQLEGSIPEELGQLGALTKLSLEMNQLEGSIPKELGQLGALTKLSLQMNQLEGSIPKELGQLGALTILYLCNNKLEGSIPKELGQLGALTKLSLQMNQLEGSIPKELGQLGALTILYLHTNKLEGSIPKELGQLGALTKLSLEMNQLEGSIPKELGQLGALTILYLCKNKLEGLIPKELGQLGALKELSLYTNQLEGSIPKELGQLGALTILYLDNNKLEGLIPKELGQLGALTELSLQMNQLEGSIPKELGQLGALTLLYLCNNKLEGSIPKELGQLGALTKLSLQMNQLEGSIPKELGQLGALTKLSLEMNQLEGSIPKELGQLGALTILYLCKNKLEGLIPKELGQLGALKELSLYTNQLEGSIPKELGQLGALTILYLDNNKLEGSIPKELGQLDALTELSLRMNQLEGSIPKELGQLGALTILYLCNNKLEGSIPKELGQLGALTKLSLQMNQLEGSIPKELGQLGALTILYLYNNKLGGSIPKELGQLGALTKLSLEMNQLEGSIPKELGQLGALTILYLCKNKLEGLIPKELGHLDALKELSLYTNQLEGSIPKELGQLGALTILYLDNNKLEGSIPKELGQLGALTELSLQMNQLEGSIPKELGQLGALTILYLCNNKLEGSIPKELGQLGALTKLSLQMNQLEGSIPKELGKLGSLTKLYLRNNKLGGSLPKELGQLGALTLLNLSVNQLEGSIPKELGQLGALTELLLFANKLEGSIPKELGKLSALTKLCLYTNKLEVLPLATAVALRNINPELQGNPWREPPSDVVGQGLDAVIRYWKDSKSYGRGSFNRLKVVLVGLSSAGKTSLAIRLEGRHGDSLPGEEERTVGVEIRDIYLKPSPVSHPQHSGQDLAVKLWDFAGERAYYDTHQIFLTKDALYILVVDVSTYRVEHTPQEAMEQWIDIIQSRVPGTVVLLVGTHKDALPSTDVRDERMEKLHQDVEDCNCRLREELEARQSALDSRSDQVVRVVNGHNVFLLDCKSSGENEINRLRSFIVKVAYSRDYSFPSVESQIPTPWMYAFLTLEAIRLGADLRGVSSEMTAVLDRLSRRGDPKTSKCYVFFDDALVLFKDLWKTMGIGYTPERAGEVFSNAIELNEAQGSILLTNRDGSVDNKCGGQVNRSQLILHVDPVRFADVVRRIVDIRLVDSASKPKIKDALIRFVRETKGVSLAELSRQQERFYTAGEVSKNYLRFLWLHRELDLGQAAKQAPPLEMTEKDVEAMVGSLVDLRMMFPVRKNSRDYLSDNYVVGACLPDHLGCEMTPESLLELDVGSAMFRSVLQIVGTRNMPPGLMPRLLAWCGRGEGRITACWRHGGCFTYRERLVLIYESRISERQSSIVCCAKGDANTETAGGVLEDITEELDRLIHDRRYGFPGIELCRDGNIEKVRVAQDNDLEKLLQRLEKDLEDHMNLRFDELEKLSERIANGVNACLHSELGVLRGHLEGIERKIDFAAALAGKCLLVSSKDGCPCPRLVWIEEDVPGTAQPLSKHRFNHFRRKRWLRRGKASATRFRLRFMCAHDYSLVACGADGKGYVLEQKNWQRWLQTCLPVLQLTLWALRTGVSVIARADLVPMDDMLAALKEIAGESVANRMKELDLKPASHRVGTMQSYLDEQAVVYGKAYKTLASFVEEEETKIAEMAGGKPSGSAPRTAGNMSLRGGRRRLPRLSIAGSTIPTFERSFERDMVFASRVVSSTGEVELAWVRRDNEKAWKAAGRSMISEAAP